MRYSTRIKPISYLKASAAEVLEKLLVAIASLANCSESGSFPGEVLTLRSRLRLAQ